MRILYHHRTLADGAEGVHIAEMVKAFRSLGHEVRVLGLAADDAAPGRRGWIARVRNVCPQVVFEAAALLTNMVEYVQARRAIVDFKPHLVYKRHARNDVGAIEAAVRMDVPVVLEVNCLFTGSGYRQFEPMALERVARWLEQRALTRATVTVTVSTPLARQVRDVAGIDAVVVPNGADPDRFDPSKASGAAVRQRFGLGDALVVGWTGVLRDWHGLELLLSAVARMPNAQLLVVGDGPARASFESRCTELGLTSRVTITGRVPHADVPNHIAAMDIAVVASDRTGVASPMKMLEYMAMGRAVAAPALPNISDVVTHARDGWLFQPDDSAALLQALTTLGADPALRERLGSEARATVVRDRNWRSIATRVLKLMASSSMPVHYAQELDAPGSSTLMTASRSDEKSGDTRRV